jgi:ABC-type multidrug transport system permease subunit
MDDRRNLYVAACIGASLSYIFNVLAFTGTFDVFRWFVFVAIFLGFTYGFETFIGWQTDSD